MVRTFHLRAFILFSMTAAAAVIVANSADSAPPYCDGDYPIIIVGSGLAGHSAAAQLYSSTVDRHPIIIFEKEGRFGGNSMKATSGINGAGTEFQALAEEPEIKDSVEEFYEDTKHSAMAGNAAETKYNPALMHALTSNSASAVDWLKNEFGLQLTSISQCGGHSHPRTHRPPAGPAGNIIVKTVHKWMESKMASQTETETQSDTESESESESESRIEFKYNCEVTEILMDEETKTAIGVRYRDHNNDGENENANENGVVRELFGAAVILTSGGYANDHSAEHSLLDEYSLANENLLATTNGVWATGDGIKMGHRIGAQLIDMTAIQVHPTGFIQPSKRESKTKFLAPEALRGLGSILVNKNGRRFVNELDLRSVVVAAEKAQQALGLSPFFLIMNEEVKQKFGANLNFYIKFGLVRKYENARLLCANEPESNMSEGALRETLAAYNAHASALTADEFGKERYPVSGFDVDDVLYVAEVTPVIHYTMGGLKMNTAAKILDMNDEPIFGLFGAGEVTGGVHGQNRLAGNSLLECVVFGRIAANSAIEYCDSIRKDKQLHQDL